MGMYAIGIETYASRLGGPTHPLARDVLSYLPKHVAPQSGTLPMFGFSSYGVIRCFREPLWGMRFLNHTAKWAASAHRVFSRSAWCSMARTRSRSQRFEQLDHASMLRGVGGCKTPLSTLLSKKFGKFVVGELTAAVKPEASGL
jgi:hypothetical protein